MPDAGLAGGRKAVLLDALGTLVGLEPPWRRFVELLASRHDLHVSLETGVAALRTEMRYYRDHCHTAADVQSLAELRRACVDVVARELGEAGTHADRDELGRTLLDALRFAAYPDAGEALRRLAASGTRLVVVSNWDVSLHDVLAQTGLRPLLDGVVTSAELGSAKPARAIFDAALEIAGATPGETLHVGDSVEEDIAGARGAGIDAVLLVRHGETLFAPSDGDGAADAPRIESLSQL